MSRIEAIVTKKYMIQLDKYGLNLGTFPHTHIKLFIYIDELENHNDDYYYVFIRSLFLSDHWIFFFIGYTRLELIDNKIIYYSYLKQLEQ